MTTASPRPTVLVVDDEENIAYLVSSALRLADLDVATAATGEDALAACTPAYPDAVVLDVMLPDLDGFEVLRRLRAKGVDAPVLFLTARTDTADRVRGLTAGGDDYIIKPFALEELVARVHVALRRRGAAPAPSGRHQVHDLAARRGPAPGVAWRPRSAPHRNGVHPPAVPARQHRPRRHPRPDPRPRVAVRLLRRERDHRVVRLDPAQEGRRHRPQAHPHRARRRLHDPGAVHDACAAGSSSPPPPSPSCCSSRAAAVVLVQRAFLVARLDTQLAALAQNPRAILLASARAEASGTTPAGGAVRRLGRPDVRRRHPHRRPHPAERPGPPSRLAPGEKVTTPQGRATASGEARQVRVMTRRCRTGAPRPCSPSPRRPPTSRPGG